jgi:hypothetical protein
MLRPTLFAIAFVYLASCASGPFSASAPFTADDAKRIAIAEVKRRGYTIPQHWHIVAEYGEAIYEMRPPAPGYTVRFQSGASERSTVFKVAVDAATRQVDDFTDMRTLDRSR